MCKGFLKAGISKGKISTKTTVGSWFELLTSTGFFSDLKIKNWNGIPTLKTLEINHVRHYGKDNAVKECFFIILFIKCCRFWAGKHAVLESILMSKYTSMIVFSLWFVSD